MRETNSIVGFRTLSVVGATAMLLMTTGCGFVSVREYPTSTPTPTYSNESSSDNVDSSGNGVDVIIIDPSQPSSTSSSNPSASQADVQQEVALKYQELLNSMYNMDETQYNAYQTIAEKYPTLEPEQIPMINILMLNTFPWLNVVNTENVSDLDVNTAYATLATQSVAEYEKRAGGSGVEVVVPPIAVTVAAGSTATVFPNVIEMTKDGQSVDEELGKADVVNFVNSGNGWYLQFEGNALTKTGCERPLIHAKLEQANSSLLVEREKDMFAARLYLDFDGVLNADHPQFDDYEKALVKSTDLRTWQVKQKEITFSPTVVNTLDRFRKEYNVELVWHSTWNENLDVLNLSKPLRGLAGGRVSPSLLDLKADTNREWTQWKANALLADQKDDDLPFVWVDGEAHKYHGKHVLEMTAGTKSLLVEPREYWGLTKTNLATIEAFFASL